MTPAGITALTLAYTMVSCIPEDYHRKRMRLLLSGQNTAIGGTAGHTSLTTGERFIDRILIREKQERTLRIRRSQADHYTHFLDLKDDIEKTVTFKIIRRMPKGGLLHVHSTPFASIDWVVKNVTYRPDLYMCFIDNFDRVQFRFSRPAPRNTPMCNWTLVGEVRESWPSAASFDEHLRQYFFLSPQNISALYKGNVDMADRMQSMLRRIGPLLGYVPVWKDYLWLRMSQFLEDNVHYVEIRTPLQRLYELNWEIHTEEWGISNCFEPVLREFKKKFPVFMGVKLIFVAFRGLSPENMRPVVEYALSIHQRYPDLVAGFDLAGLENLLYPLSNFAHILLQPSSENPQAKLPYFFQAGETNWQGTETDWNLLDAILLNTTRIGHGFALAKHPYLMKHVKDHGIAIEVTPIANQVLMLVEDLRNHPATVLLSHNCPVVIGSSDPPSWGALPLSHDFYMTFTNLLGENEGLAALKQLALNSLRYSAMPKDEKKKAITKWNRLWYKFVADIVKVMPPCF